MSSYNLTHIKELEAESIYVLREVFSEFQNPAILFSGGKDSIVVTHLAQKAFHPGKIPFPLVHIDTGHNFPETIAFRDNLVEKLGVKLVVGSVQESIDKGAAVEEKGKNATRNAIQTITLLDTIEENQFDACLGGARQEGTKKKHGPKNDSFHTGMSLVNGTLKIKDLNCGIFSMPSIIMGNTSGFSRSVTGQKWMSGNISWQKKLRFHLFILPMTGK